MLRGSHQCTSLRIGKSELFHRQRQETSYCKGSTMLESYEGLSCPYEPKDTAFMIQVVIAPFQVLIFFSALSMTTTLIGFLFVGISTIYTICVSCFLLTTSGARVWIPVRHVNVRHASVRSPALGVNGLFRTRARRHPCALLCKTIRHVRPSHV